MPYRADTLKVMALHWLRRRYPDALLVEEMALAHWGESQVDIAAIQPTDNPSLTGAEIVGVEVKGDGDSARRLERQGYAYSRVATRMWLLPSPSLQDKLLPATPLGWGWLTVADDGTSLRNGGAYQSKGGRVIECRTRDAERLENTAETLANVLWKDEALVVANRLRVSAGRRMAKHEIARDMAEIVPLRELRNAVVQQLYDRAWNRMNGGPKRGVYYPGDPLPELSDVEAA